MGTATELQQRRRSSRETLTIWVGILSWKAVQMDFSYSLSRKFLILTRPWAPSVHVLFLWDKVMKVRFPELLPLQPLIHPCSTYKGILSGVTVAILKGTQIIFIGFICVRGIVSLSCGSCVRELIRWRNTLQNNWCNCSFYQLTSHKKTWRTRRQRKVSSEQIAARG